MSQPLLRKPGHYHDARRRRSYRRVLLAVYWLGDLVGATCEATNAELAREAGVSIPTVKRYLLDMEQDEAIAVVHVPHWKTRRRQIIILDHPDAGAYLGILVAEWRGVLNRPTPRIRR